MASIQEQADNNFICIIGGGSEQSKSVLFYSVDNFRKRVVERRNLDTGHLLYYRHFTSVFDALAHKLMLDSLCDASLNCVISRMNPGWEDLRDGMRDELGE